MFLLASLSLALPLFVAPYVPIQDLPQHVAAVRVLHDFEVPALAFSRFFERSLLSTQYLSVYLLADVLTSVLGALLACKCILAASMVGVPYAARKLLAELRQPPSHALFTLPLAYHAHWLLGFINFVAALPLMLWGLALALRWQRQGSPRTGLALGALCVVTFFTHVVPFAVLAVASLVLALGGGVRATLRRLWPLLPCALATAVWLATSPAGDALRALAGAGLPHGAPSFATPEQALRELPSWLTDTLVGSSDGWSFVAWLLLCSTVLALGVRGPIHAAGCHTARACQLRARLALLVPLAWAAYFVLPTAYAFIWPINARFPILALLLASVLLPPLEKHQRVLAGALCVGLSVANTFNVSSAFRRAWETEYAGLPAIIASIPEGSRVVGLIWSPGSELVHFSPYLHAVAWVQAERGGAVLFSFADFPQSPFRFKVSERPPAVPPRWEWTPERVNTERDLGYFEYLLTRGGPRQLPGWQQHTGAGGWALWVPAPG